MTEKSTSVKLLRLMASAIDSFTNAEVERLLSGESKLLVSAPVRQQSKRAAVQDKGVDEIINGLNRANDRDEARAVLSDISNKEGLTAVAKSQKIHITKQDRREDIEHKIIEFFIGARLRTDAIKSLNMKGGGDG